MLLVNQTAFENWLQRSRTTSQVRMAQLQSMQGERVGSFRDWFEPIKNRAEGSEFDRVGSVAVIRVQGPLSYHYDIWSWMYESSSYKGIVSKVRAAADDNSIDRIVLDVHSPGGVHMGCPEAADAVYEARASKEVISVVDFEAASAGYYIASQATRIVGLKSGWVGSIGSQILLHSASRMYEKEGIDIEVIRSDVSPDKNLGIPFEPISDEARKERQGWVDQAGKEFVAAVARGRGMSEDAVLNKFGKGKMTFMEQAKSLGMVDDFGDLRSVLQSVKPTNNTSASNRSRSSLDSHRNIDTAIRLASS